MNGMGANGGSAVVVDLPWRGKQRPRGCLFTKKENVMRTLKIALALAVVVSVAAAGQVVVLVERIQDLPLSDAQEAKIVEIRKESRAKVQEAAKELGALAKEEVQKIRDVLTAEQKEKIQNLKEVREERREECLAHAIASLKELDLTDAEMTKIGEIRKDFGPKLLKSMKELDGMLTDEQKKIRTEALTGGKKRSEILEALKLTDEQKTKVVTVGKEVGGLVREEMEHIGQVLSKSQKEQLAELKEERKEQVRHRLPHQIMNLKDLNLTDEQKTKLAEIRTSYRPKVQEVGNRLRATVRDEVEKIAAVIKE
jgi:Spy/CpxP family protein refolding chaperone